MWYIFRITSLKSKIRESNSTKGKSQGKLYEPINKPQNESICTHLNYIYRNLRISLLQWDLLEFCKKFNSPRTTWQCWSMDNRTTSSFFAQNYSRQGNVAIIVECTIFNFNISIFKVVYRKLKHFWATECRQELTLFTQTCQNCAIIWRISSWMQVKTILVYDLS